MPDPRTMTSPLAPSGVADRSDRLAEMLMPLPRSHPSALPTTAADRPVDRPVVRETARHVALAATREASTRGRLADAAGALEVPSAELVGLLGRLESTVGRFVRGRRDRGLPVERVLSEVKGLVREASALDGWCDPADTLMARVVGWTIMAYYHEPEPAHVPHGS